MWSVTEYARGKITVKLGISAGFVNGIINAATPKSNVKLSQVGRMMDKIIELWRLAVEEFVENAHKCFQCNSVIGAPHNLCWYQPKSNSRVEMILSDEDRGVTHVRVNKTKTLIKPSSQEGAFNAP